MTTQLMPLHNLVPGSNLGAYIHTVNSLPLLTFEREQELARTLRDSEDLNAARELVLSHLRFVVHIARSYSGYGLPIGDLIQEGNVGLMKAVKRFDPDKGVRLVSFAVHWIRAEIHEFVLRNWRIVKVATTKAQRKLFFNLRKAKNRLGWLSANEAQAVADDLGVAVEEVVRMEGRLAANDMAFDGFNDGDDDDVYVPAQFLEDHRYDPARQLEETDTEESAVQGLTVALEQLDERSRLILQRRWLMDVKATLHELADELGVSAERVRQLEANAMKKVKAALVA